LGPFVEAHLRVYKNKSAALGFLKPLQEHLYDAGIGSISEIFSGDPPFSPNGCIAQAWSVAEVLRVWKQLTAAP
jgi:glycogen debranching enzyme